MGEVVITHAVRTPIGRIGGALRDVSEKELGSLVVKELLRRSALAEGEIDQVILGHPLGCTGAALTVKCLYELRRLNSHRYGLITMCCAGGLGVAMIMEKY